MVKQRTGNTKMCTFYGAARYFALTVCCGLLISCTPPPSPSPISDEAFVLTDPWIRQAPPGAKMLAAYGTLHNRSTQEIQIVRVESDRFASAMFHETTITDGVARMRMLPTVIVMPKSSIKFAPGGMHMMLMEPTAPVAIGENIKIQFTLKNGTQVSADFLVEKR